MGAKFVRKASASDLPNILLIIHEAKNYLKKQNIDQWQDGSPSDEAIAQDVAKGIAYVLVVDNQIAGFSVIVRDFDPTYQDISEGNWDQLTVSNYLAIHRFVIAKAFRGQQLSTILISNLLTIACKLGYYDIRIDTHPKNYGMQRVITNNGFTYRGVIHLANHAPRYAYQLLLI